MWSTLELIKNMARWELFWYILRRSNNAVLWLTWKKSKGIGDLKKESVACACNTQQFCWVSGVQRMPGDCLVYHAQLWIWASGTHFHSAVKIYSALVMLDCQHFCSQKNCRHLLIWQIYTSLARQPVYLYNFKQNTLQL